MLTFFPAPAQVASGKEVTTDWAEAPVGTFVPLSYSITEAAFEALGALHHEYRWCWFKELRGQIKSVRELPDYFQMRFVKCFKDKGLEGIC